MNLTFGKGGFQGGRGNGRGAEWCVCILAPKYCTSSTYVPPCGLSSTPILRYVENVLEELDFPRE